MAKMSDKVAMFGGGNKGAKSVPLSKSAKVKTKKAGKKK